jgi:hypothetical protein
MASEMSMGQTILLKSVSSMAKGYFEKNPTADLKISVTQVKGYIESNYPEFKVDIKVTADDILLILSKK